MFSALDEGWQTRQSATKQPMAYISASTIQAAILQYLAGGSHDTVEEIAGWWHQQHQHKIVPQRLRLILAELVRDGSIFEQETTRGTVYGLATTPEPPRKRK